MIVFERQGNIFDTSLQALVCPVNTVGAMGKGLALQFKQRYPGLEWAYRQACLRGQFKTGFIVWSADATHKVVCVPTKRDWRNPSKLEWIDQSLAKIAEHYESHGLHSLAIPAIGCGEGRLQWSQVRPLIYHHFADHPLQVGIFCPADAVPTEPQE